MCCSNRTNAYACARARAVSDGEEKQERCSFSLSLSESDFFLFPFVFFSFFTHSFSRSLSLLPHPVCSRFLPACQKRKQKPIMTTYRGPLAHPPAHLRLPLALFDGAFWRLSGAAPERTAAASFTAGTEGPAARGKPGNAAACGAPRTPGDVCERVGYDKSVQTTRRKGGRGAEVKRKGTTAAAAAATTTTTTTTEEPLTHRGLDELSSLASVPPRRAREREREEAGGFYFI